jgi:putative MFS transporter
VLTPSEIAEAAMPPLIRRIDFAPIGRWHLAIVAVCSLGFLFDLSEIAFGSALSAVFSSPPHSLAAGPLSWLLSSVYLGAIFGAPVLGTLSDWRGRRTSLVVAMLFLAIASFAAASSSGFLTLTAWRFLSGLSLGAYPPLMIAYLTDVLPARNRGRLVMASVAIGYLGPPGTITLIRALTPIAPFGIEAWRWALLLCAGGAAVAGALFLLLPESPRWLILKGQPTRAVATVLRLTGSSAFPAVAEGDRPISRPSEPTLFAGGTTKGRFLLVATLSFLSPWATIAFPLLSGAILIRLGFRLSDALLYIALSNLGPLIGTLIAASVADRIERRTALIVCAAGMVGSGAGFWVSHVPFWIVMTTVSFNVFVALYIPALSLYAAELFSTEARARTTSVAWSINRGAAALGPLVLLPVMAQFGVGALLAVITGVMTASIVLVAVAGPIGEAGRPVR